MSTTTTEKNIFQAIQRRDSAELTSYLAELDASVGKAGASKLSTPVAYTGLVSGDLAIVQALLANKQVDPSMLDDGALIEAAKSQRTDIVQVLLSDARVSPLAENGRAFVIAASSGNVAMFHALSSRAPNSAPADLTLPLAIAARMNCLPIVESIATRFKSPECPQLTSAQLLHINMSLVFASKNGNQAIVREILSIPGVNVNFANDAAYLTAHKFEKQEVMKMLADTGKVNHDAYFADASAHPSIDLEISDPRWWVPKTAVALKFFADVVNAH
ncbi:hypothetical protein HDU98_006519 [Podochytrium sp. JEL0797]|nr:hypothetical protein HDU98_006519 [Podochytrium sp. JEL0797]